MAGDLAWLPGRLRASREKAGATVKGAERIIPASPSALRLPVRAHGKAGGGGITLVCRHAGRMEQRTDESGRYRCAGSEPRFAALRGEEG